MQKEKFVHSKLWGDDPHSRLISARELSDLAASQVQEFISSYAPMKPWPFGMATVVNPYIDFWGHHPGTLPPATTLIVPQGLFRFPRLAFPMNA